MANIYGYARVST
ncbi:Protein of unknown function [Bacillus wiedmannii]|uniref:Uncharacterized protein n=1 Tax=Bacillus wiedmannii TaxID=1890302 RepID=A0A1C4FG39_9BACI|nr:Protein of unknown function [Bacillus wiedmannii]